MSHKLLVRILLLIAWGIIVALAFETIGQASEAYVWTTADAVGGVITMAILVISGYVFRAVKD